MTLFLKFVFSFILDKVQSSLFLPKKEINILIYTVNNFNLNSMLSCNILSNFDFVNSLLHDAYLTFKISSVQMPFLPAYKQGETYIRQSYLKMLQQGYCSFILFMSYFHV